MLFTKLSAIVCPFSQDWAGARPARCYWIASRTKKAAAAFGQIWTSPMLFLFAGLLTLEIFTAYYGTKCVKTLRWSYVELWNTPPLHRRDPENCTGCQRFLGVSTVSYPPTPENQRVLYMVYGQYISYINVRRMKATCKITAQWFQRNICNKNIHLVLVDYLSIKVHNWTYNRFLFAATEEPKRCASPALLQGRPIWQLLPKLRLCLLAAMMTVPVKWTVVSNSSEQQQHFWGGWVKTCWNNIPPFRMR